MEKIIKIGKTEVKLDNNAAWAMEYRDQFGKDILPVILPMGAALMEMLATVAASADELSLKGLAESLEGRVMDILEPLVQVEMVDILINVTWAMAKVADESIDPPKKWIRQFDSFPIDVVAPTVYDMAMKGFISSKNQKRLKSAVKSLKNLQPSLSMKSSSQDSSED